MLLFTDFVGDLRIDCIIVWRLWYEKRFLLSFLLHPSTAVPIDCLSVVESQDSLSESSLSHFPPVDSLDVLLTEVDFRLM